MTVPSAAWLWPRRNPQEAIRSDLASLYEFIRLRVMGAGLVIAIAVGIITGWPSGPFVQLAAAGVFLHALYLRLSGTPPGRMTLLIDGAGIALATLTMSIPVVTATAFCFYAVVASVLANRANIKWVGIFVIAWVAFSLTWMDRHGRTPYEPDVRVIIEVSTVTFFAAAITLIVAAVIARLRQAEQERREAADELQRSNEELERLIQTKDRFVASVSHELRTPLTAVLGLAQELSGPTTDLSASDLDEAHRLIAGEAEEVASIVEDLLVAARADIGEVRVFPEDVQLEDLVAQTLTSLSPRPTSVSVSGTSRAFADPVRVRQVIRNLVVNADRYGGPNIRIDVGYRDGRAHVSVADDGGGIPGDRVDQIFEPYQTAHDPSATVGSIGLGLSVSRTLARLMGGDLEYTGQAGWSSFTLSLPAAD